MVWCLLLGKLFLITCNAAIDGTTMASGNLRIDPPLCPNCNTALMPLALFFDEMYASHRAFRYDDALHWLDECDSIVFVGTSFSVGITAQAAQRRWAKLYNFNIHAERGAPARSQLIQGSCEETLPAVLASVMSVTVPRIFFVPSSLPALVEEEKRKREAVSAAAAMEC